MPSELEPAVAAAEAFKEKCVFTVRSKNQGGKFQGPETERVALIERLTKMQPMFMDIELDTIKENDHLADLMENSKTKMIVSWHDFEHTPASEDLSKRLTEMRIYSNYLKIVTMAKIVDDSLRLLDLYEVTAGLNPIIFGMGEAGVLSRVLCTVVGNAPFAYASLGAPVAPGQLSLVQMRRLYERLKIR